MSYYTVILFGLLEYTVIFLFYPLPVALIEGAGGHRPLKISKLIQILILILMFDMYMHIKLLYLLVSELTSIGGANTEHLLAWQRKKKFS